MSSFTFVTLKSASRLRRVCFVLIGGASVDSAMVQHLWEEKLPDVQQRLR